MDLSFSGLLKHFLLRRYRKHSGVTCDHNVFSLRCVCPSCSNRAYANISGRMKTIFLVCVLGLLAASLAENTAQTEPVDGGAGLDRGVRDVTEEREDVDTDTDLEITNRQKRRC